MDAGSGGTRTPRRSYWSADMRTKNFHISRVALMSYVAPPHPIGAKQPEEGAIRPSTLSGRAEHWSAAGGGRTYAARNLARTYPARSDRRRRSCRTSPPSRRRIDPRSRTMRCCFGTFPAAGQASPPPCGACRSRSEWAGPLPRRRYTYLRLVDTVDNLLGVPLDRGHGRVIRNEAIVGAVKVLQECSGRSSSLASRSRESHGAACGVAAVGGSGAPTMTGTGLVWLHGK